MRFLRWCAVLELLSCSVLWAQTPKELTIVLPGDIPLEFVWIEPSTFTMGTTEAQKAFMDSLRSREGPTSGINRYNTTELPAHQVTITEGFYLGKYEVTQTQWEAVMGTTPWDRFFSDKIGPDKPAVGISWFDVQEFMHRLNEAAGDSLYRLPTEAEWECGCRGGTETLWFTGDDPSAMEAYINFSDGIQPVGSRLPNPYGLYDMGGNAEEWVLDGVREYTSSPQVDPLGPIPQNEEDRIYVKGGAATYPFDGPRFWQWRTRCGSRPGAGVPAGSDAGYQLSFRVFRRGDSATSIGETSWGQMKKGQP